MSDATRDGADGNDRFNEGVARERNIFRDDARRDDGLRDGNSNDGGARDGDDRLPWLEAAEEDESDRGVSPGKLAALVVAALIALGIVIGGVWLLRQDAPAPKDPTLIAAQEGDYKVKPDAPGGMRVEGKGDSAFAASEGAEANGRIDLNKLPETPIAGAKGVTKADATASAGAKPGSTANVAVGKPAGALVAKNPVSASGGRQVQLGAFGTQAKAEAVWSQLTRRHAFLGGMSKQIVTADVNGTTVYRLRAGAGGEASGICAKLRAAGDTCLVVS